MIKKLFSKDNNYIEGSIFKNIISLALPLMIGGLLHGTQSLVDMFWVSSLGAESIAAVAMGSTIIMFVFTLVSGISIGTISLVAKNIGANNKKGADIIANQACILGLFLSLVVAVLGIFFSHKFLIFLGASSEVVLRGANYLRILMVASFTLIFLFIGNSALQGAGDTFHPMAYMILANILNIILDPLFIFGWLGVPRMGTSGAAVAAIIGQGAAGLLAFRLLEKKTSKVNINFKSYRFDFLSIRQILKVGLPASLQMFFRAVSNMALIGLVAIFGTVAIAGFGIVMRLHFNILMPSFSLGIAAATMMGQNMGAGKIKRAKQSAWVATIFSLIIMAVVGVFFFKFSQQIISIFSKDLKVISLGSDFMRICAFFYIFIAFGIVLNRALGGAGDTLVPMLITLFSLWVYLIPGAFYLSRQTNLGIYGIWWAVATSNAVNGILILIWFEMGRWKRIKTALIKNRQ